MQTIPGEYLEIDRKARVYMPYQDLTLRPPTERVCDFGDAVVPLDSKRAMLEASRCIHCPDPAPCMLACPCHNDIPSAMWLIEQGRYIEAAQLYRQTSSLPEICSRVCPHEQLCQGSCVLNKTHEPVLCGPLETFVTCYERKTEGVAIPVGQPGGKKVAIVGAGPAGLGCAEKLLQKGHAITFFDSKPAPGGLLVYGIPNFKLAKEVFFCRWGDYEKAGAKFVGNTYIGKDKSIDDLFKEGFDAVFVGVGVGIDAKMEVPGEDLPGVYEATDFLMRGNTDLNLLPEDKRERPRIGKRVAVIGGGDTASDCLRTALRIGAEQVICLYRRTEKEMPGGKKDRQMAKEEGAQYRFLTQPVKFIAGEDGQLAAIECIEMKLGEPDAKGRRKPLPIEGSNFSIAVDTAIKALGYWPDPVIGESTPGLETHDWGMISVVDKETGATSRAGVFAGGDVVSGPSTVVQAIGMGRDGAESIHRYLR
ncbi:MAG: NAD(P)-dependent oxidoreductase, partial [Anaerolineales bacterium]|nr:NAD(P)-dependent oxidoreductase [Anaerolineales bacterium]